jgi:hypothetical protein
MKVNTVNLKGIKSIINVSLKLEPVRPCMDFV